MDLNKLTLRSREALTGAQQAATERNHQQVEPEHLLLALLGDAEGVIYPLLHALGLSPRALRDPLEERLARMPKVYGAAQETTLSRSLRHVLERAFTEASALTDDYVSTEHLLLAMLEGATDVARLLADAGLTRDAILSALAEVRGRQRVTDENPEEKYQALERYGRDLTELARRGKLDPVIGRDDEIRRVIQVLSRRTKNNPVLIGEPGVGKTAIVEGLASRIVEGDIPEGLKGKRVVAIDIGSLVAGTKYRGEFEERFKAVLREIAASDGEIITFIDELHTVVGAGAAEGAVDAGNMLKPMLARGELRAIGATTLDEYRKHIEKDPALERRFQPVLVGPPSTEDTIAILRGLKERYEVHHGVRIKDEALVAAAVLSDRYVTGRFLPDKAIDLIDEAASRLRIEIDSMPTEIDEIDRRVRQLEIERAALKKESDPASVERLEKLEAELADLNERLRPMRAHWEREKEHITGSARSRRRSRSCGARRTEPSGTASSSGPPSCGTDASSSSRSASRRRTAGWRRSSPRRRCSRRRSTRRTWPRWSRCGPASRSRGSWRARWPSSSGWRTPSISEWSVRITRSRRSRKRSAGPEQGFPIRTDRSARSCSSAPPVSARPSWPERWRSTCSTTSGPWSGST